MSFSRKEISLSFSVASYNSLATAYASQYTRKGSGKPDGCALFYRREAFESISVRTVAYVDDAGAWLDNQRRFPFNAIK